MSADAVLPFAKGRTKLFVPLAVLLVLCVLSVGLGPAEVGLSFGDAIASLVRPNGPDGDLASTLVWQVRMPRAVLAMAVGALLAMSGAALQGMLMNPLADPYVCGGASGAALGAATVELMAPALGIAGALHAPSVALAAFLGALGATLLVYRIARIGGRLSVTAFLLAGIAVGTLLWSLIPLGMAVANRTQDMPRILHYLLGSLQGADWRQCALLASVALAVGLLMRRGARELDLMTLGEESAHHLGVEVERVKRRALAVSSLATAAAVSVAGVVGFVGLTAPHIARRLCGAGHRKLVPMAALTGAAMTLGSDIVVRVLLNDAPLGTVTAIVGAPLFVWLVRGKR